MNIPSSRDHKINLILATDCRRQHPRDLTEIAENVVRIAPDIAVHVVSTEDSPSARKVEEVDYNGQLLPDEQLCSPSRTRVHVPGNSET